MFAFLLASVCSGCAALLNQILWARILSLVFGSTIEAVSAVTAVFMAGLALGSAIAPRWVRGRAPEASASLYVRIEVVIGASGLCLAFLLPLLESLRASAGAGPAWIAAGLLLLPPSILMGTTLVALSAAAGSEGSLAPRAAGLLFSANTFGAMLGAYGAVLALMPALGVRATLFLAAGLNLTAAALARLSAGKISTEAVAVRAPADPNGEAPRSRKKKQTPASSVPDSRPLSTAALLAVMGSLATAGFAGLANEVAWTRAFILITGPTVHAFAFVLGAIIFGLAIGALVSSLALRFIRDSWLAFALLQSAVAAMGARILHRFVDMPLTYGEDVRRLVEQPEALMRLQAGQAFVLLAPAAALSGALLPMGLKLLSARYGASGALGFASAANTAGAIFGALLAGFVLLPALGLAGTLKFVAVLSAISAISISMFGSARSRAAGALAGLLAIAFVATRPPLDNELLAGGAYKYSAYDLDLPVEDVLRRGELVSYVEGRLANVSVKRIGASYSLAVDGKVDATSSGDMLTQRLLAHVPFLIHPKPETALVIGLGSGVTAAAALSHGPRSVTAVEISPDVVDAARKYFAQANERVLENPALSLVVGDARQHVLATPERYDVIISEPSNPWMAGVSSLFTREFFGMAKARLAPGGVFCQWGHLYNMSSADLTTLLATFGDVFEHARVFVISEADILIVGGARDPAFGDERLEKVAAAAKTDLERSRLLPSIMKAIPSRSLSDLSSRARESSRHTDDRPVFDFSGPLSIHAQTARENRLLILGPDDVPSVDAAEERLTLLGASSSAEWTYDVAQRAIERGWADRRVALSFVRSAVTLRRTEAAETKLAEVLSRFPSSAPLLGTRALLYWNTGRPAEALRDLESASRADPSDVSAYFLAAEIQSAAGDTGSMRKLLARAASIDPRNPEIVSLAAVAFLKDGQFEPALERARAALLLDARDTRALEVQALSLAQLGRNSEARVAFERLLTALPDDPAPRNNFGVFELQTGDAARAASLFEDAVDLDPSNIDGYRGLKEAAIALGRSDLSAFADRRLALFAASRP